MNTKTKLIVYCCLVCLMSLTNLLQFCMEVSFLDDEDNHDVEIDVASLPSSSSLSHDQKDGDHGDKIETGKIDDIRTTNNATNGQEEALQKDGAKSIKKVSTIGTNNDNERNESAPDAAANDYNEEDYQSALQQAMKPNPDESICAYLHVFWSGFCNQYYMFSGVLLLALERNYTQILVQSIRWKDLFGTNQMVRHDVFFDVVHWNTFSPELPRFVTYHDKNDRDGEHEHDLFSDVTISLDSMDINPNLKWNINDPYINATKPFAIGQKRTDAIMKFYDYTKHVDKGIIQRAKSDLIMMRGALTPHPAIRNIMAAFEKENKMTNIMVLHARIEPDMQKHPMCKEHKVVNITDIVQMLYVKYPEPPVSTVLIILNRAILEKEAMKNRNKTNGKTNEEEEKVNEMATYNLIVLNEMMSNGLWNGRVKVTEAGSDLAKRSNHPIYAKYSSLVGSIMNFFLALKAEIFVGTIVSSYSTAVVSYRFFRDKKENYFYMPHGLDWVTSPDVRQPPRFAC